MSVRFLVVADELGAAVADRDMRGFAAKFYIEEGHRDLVGNDVPVFLFRDPLEFGPQPRDQPRPTHQHA